MPLRDFSLELPHDDLKQISGPVISCISFDVDPNLMTVTINPEKRASLIEPVKYFSPLGRGAPFGIFSISVVISTGH
jgi:hypothetical protein